MGLTIQALLRRGSCSFIKRATFLANQVIITNGSSSSSIIVDSSAARNYCSTTASTGWLREVADTYDMKPMFQDIREYAILRPHPRESLLRDRSFDLLRDKIGFSKTLLLLAEAQSEKEQVLARSNAKERTDFPRERIDFEKERIDFAKLSGAYKKMGGAEAEAFKKYVSDVVYDKVSHLQLIDESKQKNEALMRWEVDLDVFSSDDLEENSVFWNSKLRNLVLAGRADRAEFMFKAMPKKWMNIHTWNIMVYCFSNIDLDKAESYFDSSPVKSKFSRLCLMDSYVRAGYIDDARDLFLEDDKTDTLACNTMLFGYTYFNLVKEACKLFEEMGENRRDIVSYDLMLLHHWYNEAMVFELFGKIPKGELSATSYNVRLRRLIREEEFEDGKWVLKEMFDAGLVPDQTTLDLAVEIMASGNLDVDDEDLKELKFDLSKFKL